MLEYSSYGQLHLLYQTGLSKRKTGYVGRVLFNRIVLSEKGKKKGKKKRKGQGGKKEAETKGVDPEAMKRFQKLLKVYYKEYDMLEVSRLLEACMCLL